MAPEEELIKVQVHDKLMESGEFERMKAHLRSKLQESGWFDDVNALALDKLSAEESPKLDIVAQSLESQALSMIPDDVKIELLKMIRTFLDSWIDSRPK